jgi:hypothetical protein
MHHVMQLVDNELSEPYSIFTYRYRRPTHPQKPRVVSCLSFMLGVLENRLYANGKGW